MSNISKEFIEKSTETIKSEKEEHLPCTRQELDDALVRLYQNYHTEDQIKAALGRKYKSNLYDLLLLCNSLKYMFFKPETVMPLSTTGKLAETFGNYKKASRIIDIACEIGLLEEVNGKYSYCSITTKSIHFKPNAKEYVCNKQVLENIENKSNKENISILNTHISNIYNTVVDTFAVYAKNEQKTHKYAITSKTLIDDTDENVLIGLYNNYPYMREFQALADEINANALVSPLEEIKFQFKITRGKSGKVTKIGCRASNGIVSFKEHENKNQDYRGTWRKDYLKAVLGDYEEYDVHSSISNVTYLLNHGKWLGIDCYRPEYGSDFDENVTRDWYKSIFMRLYFNNTVEGVAKSLFSTDVEYRKTDYCKNTIRELTSNMTNFIGNTYGSEIFFHESCIYLLVRKELMKRGIKCSQVYDGFYFKKGEMPKDMNKIVKSCAEYYYAHYYMGEETMEEKNPLLDKEKMAEFVRRSQAENKKMILCEDPETGESFYLPKNAIHYIFDDGTIVYNIKGK